jgi:uncharacterized membrane protein
METMLHEIAHVIELVIEAIAILCVAIGSIEALIGVAQVMLSRRATDSERRRVYLAFARWLVAALTFQLAADIVGTAIAPSWEEVGRLAAVAAIRTFLSYFLDRDMESRLEQQREDRAGESVHST